MMRLLISRDRHETRVAVVEDGRLAEWYVERPGRMSAVGNVYKGRVQNVLAGMEAAFVDIGLDRNGYLSADDIPGADRGRGGKNTITRKLRAGEQIVVQVVREGMGGKGHRLTIDIGLPGRYVVYTPYATDRGVSRRLADGERRRLRVLVDSIELETGGLIVRTAAEGVERGPIEQDVRFLQRVWAEVERRIHDQDAPGLVYRESELAVKAVRDLLTPAFVEVVVDDEDSWRRLREYVTAVVPAFTGEVRLHQGPRPLFEHQGLERQIADISKRRVELRSGGYLVIDRTEAMTIIDVNTGRFVGRRHLEETALKTNLQACRAVVEQLRLRDIGGIVVIDFIDMRSRSNQDAVLVDLEAELAHDRAKTHVVALSPLGLVEMTRQRVGWGTGDIAMVTCPTCRGEGRVLSDESALIAVERRLRAMVGSSVTPGSRVEVHPHIATLLTAGSPSPVERIQEDLGRFIILSEASDKVPLDHVGWVAD